MKPTGPLKRNTPLRRSKWGHRAAVRPNPPGSNTIPPPPGARSTISGERVRCPATFGHAARQQPCAMCNAPPPSRAHHIVYQQVLRRIVWSALWRAGETKLWGTCLRPTLGDLRNMLPLCDRCHRAHHDAVHRVPLEVIREHAPDAHEFASELGREAIVFLRRTYPDTALDNDQSQAA